MIVSINVRRKTVTVDGSRIRQRYLSFLRKMYKGYRVSVGTVKVGSFLNGPCDKIYFI